MRRSLASLLMVLVLAGCGGQSPSASTSAFGSPSAAAPSAAPTGTESPSASSAGPTVTEPLPSDTAAEVPAPSSLSLAIQVAMAVTVAELNMRSGPSTAAKRVFLAKRDDVLLVADVPHVAGSITWYYGRLASRGAGALPELPAGLPPAIDPPEGWVAFREGSAEYLKRLPPRCPATASVGVITAMISSEHLACFEGRSIALEGSLQCRDCGGVNWAGEPAWLANGSRDPILVKDGTQLTLRFPPGLDGAAVTGKLVRLTGHFDDAAAVTCVIIDAFGPPVSSDIAVQQCRLQFVVEDLDVLGPDPDWPLQ